MTKPDLSTKVGPLVLKNPVMVASGTFGYGEEFSEFYDLSELGGIMVKGLTLKPREGNPPHRIAETPCGLLNSIGLQNVGVEAFIEKKMPFLRRFDTRIITNITGTTVKEYGEICRRLDGVDGLHAIEVNLSCPNVREGGIQFGTDPKSLGAVVRETRDATSLPLFAKLSPNVTDIVSLARVAKEEGADGVSLINTLLGMAVDLDNRAPVLSRVVGGLSGPAIKPVALRMVWAVWEELRIPIIGMGGIMSARDALEFMLVGASAIAVGTANLIRPFASLEVLRGIEEYFRENDIPSVESFVGTLRVIPDRDPVLREGST
jgi:dihydroorotate dehydrogenase (NAD+) catalytic subunit